MKHSLFKFALILIQKLIVITYYQSLSLWESVNPVCRHICMSPLHILSPVTIYADIDEFSKANWATIYAFIFVISCRQRENMPSALKQIVAENSTDLEKKVLG